MTSTPKSNQDECLGESWVDITTTTPGKITPVPLGCSYDGDMQRLLWEAQRESTQSSARVSCASSRNSPKSPPNSPNTEMCTSDEMTNVYINYNREEVERSSDWIWDWSSRPDSHPPKQFNFQHPIKSRLSMRHSKALKSGLLSTEVLSLMLITNLFSVLLGAGIGFFLGKRMAVSTFALD